MIPFLELKPAFEELETEISEAVSRVMCSGWYIGGPEVESFEAFMKRYRAEQLA